MYVPGSAFSGDLSKWEVHNVTDMYGMLRCTGVDKAAIREWNLTEDKINDMFG